VTVEIEPDLRETSYGDRDGQPMGDWFQDWVAGRSTPVGGESFADLRRRAVAAANRALARPAPVLVVAHGGLFRALRAEMGLEPNIRTANGVPFHCLPPGSPSAPWQLIPVSAI
jgi:probable phosphoglycerate mutase